MSFFIQRKNAWMLLAIAAVLLEIIFRYQFLSDPLALFDDQRNILKPLNIYRTGLFDGHYFTAPLYFGIFQVLAIFLEPIFIVKWLFMAVIPLYIFFVYRISLTLFDNCELAAPVWMPLLATLSLVFFQENLLISGYHKSVALPLLMGLIYMLLKHRITAAVILLIAIAAIYPPQFIVGISLLGVYFLVELWKEYRSSENYTVKLLWWSALRYAGILLLIFGGYFGYFSLAVTPNTADFHDGIPTASRVAELPIDPEIRNAIEKTRFDYIPSGRKFAGLIPYLYLNNKNLGFLSSDIILELWLLLIALAGVSLLLLRKHFLIPEILLMIFLTILITFSAAHLLYDRLYLPNRYSRFTLPIFLVLLIFLNLPGLISMLTGFLSNLRRRLKQGLALSCFAGAGLIGYFSLISGQIYLGNNLTMFDILFFSVLVALLVAGGTLASIFLSGRRAEWSAKLNTKLIALTGVAICLLIFGLNKVSEPVKIADRSVFKAVEQLGDDISLSGYPQMMDNVNALCQNRVRVTLGQFRRHFHAYELYQMLTAYYAGSLDKLLRYMQMGQYDYFIVQTSYFSSKSTEGNNLFSFYPAIKKYEKQLRKSSDGGYALQHPPKEILAFETRNIAIIDVKRLSAYLNRIEMLDDPQKES